ncbi:hypothetical protein MLD38_036676 [Melastoma candidum]|uniref:Uncharacterized protein n=1 Tax=Melastoma candidum TaxID=119954 RepID=A0ACB9LKN6_9MYRT|nr:hypothetical protein MLD38_036676 [Melastoma candidum]
MKRVFLDFPRVFRDEDKLVVSTSCSLMHTAVDLVNETKLDQELKSWLAFAAQKVIEVNALSQALAGQKDEAFFSANAAALASRKSSPRVTNEAVQKTASALKGSDHRRATNMTALDAQQKMLNLPILPTTSIGSFPQTVELRRVRREYKAKKISEDEYVNAIKEEINKVVKLQEERDIDVLVHGEPERNDMLEHFEGISLAISQAFGATFEKVSDNFVKKTDQEFYASKSQHKVEKVGANIEKIRSDLQYEMNAMGMKIDKLADVLSARLEATERPTTRRTSRRSSSMTKEDPILELTGVPTVPTGEPAGQSSSSLTLSNAIKEKDVRPDDATQGIGENQFLMQGLAEI